MSAELISKRVDSLRDRARMLAKARGFFFKRDVLEVDCPVLSQYACVDANIDLMPVIYNDSQRCYLHSSPEYGMKRLLAEGIGDIYQLCHVFRDGEFGDFHNPEFSMVEWYRHSLTYSEMMQEVIDFITLFLGEKETKKLSYIEAFESFLSIHPLKASIVDLQKLLKHYNIDQISNDRDEILNFLMGSVLEKKLSGETLWLIYDYPASQAALSKIEGDICKRFEVYYHGVELANAYDELIDYQEQKKRLDDENCKREQLAKARLPVDPNFLRALKTGLKPCKGVAVGFDRLMLLRQKAEKLREILPFSWESA